MNLIEKILTQRVENANQVLFNFPISDDSIANEYVDEYYNRLEAKKRIDVLFVNPKRTLMPKVKI